jgi:hypothetical protein
MNYLKAVKKDLFIGFQKFKNNIYKKIIYANIINIINIKNIKLKYEYGKKFRKVN